MTDRSFDDLWDRYMGNQVTPAEYAAPGWDMSRILGDLRELWAQHPTDRLNPAELLEVANGLAAGLELLGLPMTTATTIDTLTLTTAHAASSYGVPVLVIDGQCYGAGDMTPAGVTGAALVQKWARQFVGK